MSPQATWRVILLAMALAGLSSGVAVSSQAAPKAQEAKKPVTKGSASASKYHCDESEASCKSFRQLVASGDSDLFEALRGSPSVGEKHYAYVCLEKRNDVFNVVYFDEPAPNEYQPYPYIKSDDAKILSEYRALHAGIALHSDDPENDRRDSLMLLDAGEAWFDDHSDFFTYSISLKGITVEEYKDGIVDDLEFEPGKWRRDANTGSTSSGLETEFEGAFFWLENYNRSHDGKYAAIDLKNRLHASATVSQISVHYDFTNRDKGTTRYSLTIQRSTGRFIESFSTKDSPSDEQTGSCVIVSDIRSGVKK